jgi:hypothetical protein
VTGSKKKASRRPTAAQPEPEAHFSPWLPEPKAELPYDKLHYELTPTLARRLADIYYESGRLESLPLGHFTLEKLKSEARIDRVYRMVREINVRVRTEEIRAVASGDVLSRDKREVQEWIRRAIVLLDGFESTAGLNETSTPELCAAYLDVSANADQRGSTLWAHFVAARRSRLLSFHHGSVVVPDCVKKLYEWIDDDDLVGTEPILRGAVLTWGLFEMYPLRLTVMGVRATVLHELGCSRADHRHLLGLGDHSADRWARVRGDIREATKTGDLTFVLEELLYQLQGRLEHLFGRLQEYSSRERAEPWLTVSPPDDLDRRIFSLVQSMGSARTTQLHQALGPEVPLRTLQRRMQRLARRGLLEKHGTRKDAFYRLPLRGPIP